MIAAILAVLRNPIVLAGILVVGAFVVVNTSAGALAPGTIAPAQESYTVRGWEGKVELNGGRANNGADFVASWDREGYSEVVTVTASVGKVGHQTGGPNPFRYKVYIGDALVHQSGEFPVQTGTGGGPFVVPSITWSFKGAPGGDKALKVVLEGYSPTPSVSCPGCRQWAVFAQDGARLLDGGHELALDASTTRFAEGETATFRLKTGAGGPWKVEVFRGDGTKACGPTRGALKVAGFADNVAEQQCAALRFPGEFDGKISYLVPAGSFRTDGRNEWKLRLTNEVWARHEERVFVIDNSKLAPEVPTVTLSTTEPKVGDQVTVTLKARANGITAAAISRFTVNAWYGTTGGMPSGGENVILDRHVVTATKSGEFYTGTFTISIGKAARVQVEANAIDTFGRPSGSRINAAQAQELETGGVTDPNTDGETHIDPEGAPDEVGPYPPAKSETNWMTVLMVAAAALALAYAVFRYVPMPVNVKVLLAAGIAVGGAIFALGGLG